MSLKIINPSKGAVIREVELQDARQLDALIARARQAFDCGPWPKMPLRERKQFLLNISQGILDQAQELAQLETLNTGKPIKESTFMDVPSAARCFAYFAHHLEEYLKPEAITISEEASSQLIRQPQGLVALIVPWNYPLLIASWKMAQALAAGNTMILKPSSLTPLTALELGKIAERAGLPSGVVQVVCSSGSQIGEALICDTRVDMVSFTGSNQVGKQILGYSSQQVKKLVMELGGKSAAIVLKDADLEVAVNGSLCSAFLNQGQMCTQMSRILVQEEVYDVFVKDFVAKAARIKVGDGMSYETQMGPLISRLQREKVLASVQQAKKEGAKVLCGGVIPDAPELRQGFFFNPTLLAEVTPQMAIFQEEVFGPVVCISKFSSLEEAVALANNSRFGLANCIWSKDAVKAQELAQKINSGTTWINTYGMFYNELPYGGFKESGFGKELGREGLLEYSRLKNIITDNSKDTKPLVNYWYGV